MPNFRYTKGKPYHPNVGSYLDFKNLKLQGTSDNSLLAGNSKFFAVPILGAGGRIAVVPRETAGIRVQSNYPFIIESGAEVIEFCFNPFQQNELLTTGDDGKLRFWTIPEDLKFTNKVCESPVTIAEKTMQAHENRIHIAQFHPLVQGILLTGSIERVDEEGSVKIWTQKDDKSWSCWRTFKHSSPCTGASFHPLGRYLATSHKDKHIRIYDLVSNSLVLEGKAHDGSRGSRISWTSEDSFNLISVGFGLGSQREIMVFDLSSSLQTGVKSVSLTPKCFKPIDNSPAVLVPFYDSDTQVLYLYGRGETVIRMFQIESSNDGVSVQPIDSFSASTQQFDVVFIPKTECNVKGIEHAACYRLYTYTNMNLTLSGIEKIGFTVPRQRAEFFQDDIFVDTLYGIDRAILKAEEYVKFVENDSISEHMKSGISRARISLLPAGSTPLSKAPALENKSKANLVAQKEIFDEDERRKQALQLLFSRAKDEGDQNMASKNPNGEISSVLASNNGYNDGVESDEWDD